MAADKDICVNPEKKTRLLGMGGGGGLYGIMIRKENKITLMSSYGELFNE